MLSGPLIGHNKRGRHFSCSPEWILIGWIFGQMVDRQKNKLSPSEKMFVFSEKNGCMADFYHGSLATRWKFCSSRIGGGEKIARQEGFMN